MWKIIASALAILGVGSMTSSAATPPSKGSGDLREMVFSLQPSEIGMKPGMSSHGVWGLVMETGLDHGYYTLVALGDGTVSLYFSNGGGVIGAGTHQTVHSAAHKLLEQANGAVAYSQPASGTQPPAQGITNFYFLTFDGTRKYTAQENSLGESQDKLSPLFYAAQDVITAVREATP